MTSNYEIIVLCQGCSEPVERTRVDDGKAYCEDCEIEIFASVPTANRALTFDELIKENKKKDEEVFVRFMSRLYRKLRH